MSPKPEFVVATGDYNYASPMGSEAAAQIGKYVTARAVFSNPLFPAMGNHECTGYTNSNCGAGSANGITHDYQAFMDQLLAPLGQAQPYYTVHLSATDGTWTAKLVFIAANAWNTTQASWLTTEMAQPTTYTFVIRHEPSTATTAPGVSPSSAIIKTSSYTLLIVGHSHTYSHAAGSREVIMGLGGAPVSSGRDFGYLVISQAPDGNIVVSEYDYVTGAVNDTFVLRPDGSPA